MKVLKDNYGATDNTKRVIKKPYPRKMICEMCRSELEYEESDLRMGALGAMYIDCPLCGSTNMLEDNEGCIVLTKDNIEFPTHFFYTNKMNDGVVDCCNNEEVNKCIKRAIDYFRKNKDAYHWFTCYGNLYIDVDRYEGNEDYFVMVTDNYYTTYIPFEKEDY